MARWSSQPCVAGPGAAAHPAPGSPPVDWGAGSAGLGLGARSGGPGGAPAPTGLAAAGAAVRPHQSPSSFFEFFIYFEACPLDGILNSCGSHHFDYCRGNG
jgi:hypothetical protein